MIEARAPTQGGLTGIREALRFVNRQKLLILAPTILLAGAAWGVAALTVPRYAATSALTLDVSKVQFVDREVVSRLPLESSTLRSEIDVIRSRSLNDEVVIELGLRDDPGVAREVATWQSREPEFVRAIRRALAHFLPAVVARESAVVPRPTEAELTDWILGNLSVSNDGRSLTILISFTSESPQRAALIANQVAKTYLDDQVLTKVRATTTAGNWLGQRVDEIRQQLEKSEAAVDDFRRKSGLLEVRGATIPAERLGDLNAQLSAARTERMRAEANLQIARQSNPETLPDNIASPMLQQLRKELAQINLGVTDLQDHGAFYKIRDLGARAAVLRAQTNAEMSRIVARLSSEVAAAHQKEAQLEQSFQAMNGQLGDATHSGVRLMQLQREADANRSIYETFLARYKMAMQQESLEAPDARLISRAEPPEEPVSPRKLRSLLLGVIGGLAIGGGLALLREGFDRRIRQAADIESVTGIPVYGFLPKVSRWRSLQPQDYPVNDPHSRFGTALVRIHTALRAPNPAERKQVVLVTSAQPGDGKTSFCTGLARSLAKSRIRVLVIDADPYRSRVASAFGAASHAAFGPIVGQSVRLDDLVQTDTKSAAHFITAPSEDDLALLLHSGGFTKMLEEARQTYDIVIIDTPPVMTSADAALIGRFADTRLLLVRWGRTSWDEMTAAVGFLRLCHVGLDGIVMVGVDAGFPSYGQVGGYGPAATANQFLRPLPRRGMTEVE